MDLGPAFMQGPIVVGTDFSHLSWSVVDYAAELALEESKSLHLVYVMPIVPDDSFALLQIQKQELKNQVNAVEKKLRGSGLKIESALVMGTAAHQLIQLADELAAAYIVVGTQGLSGLERLLLGSVAEAVIRKSDRPVIVVGPHAAAIAKKTVPWKHLMLACDTAAGVTEAARLAGDIASGHQAHLTIFTVREEGIQYPSEDQFEAIEKMMGREAWLTVKPQCLVREGEPAKEIVRMVEDTQADLLVMSVHRGGELLTHLRSGIMAKVLRMSRCPAMVLRDIQAPHPTRAGHHANH
ncbi:MAG: universal stress protein [Acidobacteriaceae bacterium]